MINFANHLILDYEKDSDRRIAAICSAITALTLVVILLNVLHVFKISTALYPTLIGSAVILLMPTYFFDIMHMRSKFIRYLVLTLLVFMSGLMYSILSYHVIIMLILPVVVSCLYCERAYVIYTTMLSIPAMVVSHLIAFQLKIVPDEPLVTLRGVVLYGITPRIIELVAIAVICIGITGKLTDDEFAEIKKHVDYGYQLLEKSPGEIMQLAAEIAWQHHERYDGTGYQNKVKGEQINIYARCVAVADVFDALVSKRCYKKAWTPQQAREEIVSQAGRQFDPKITQLFDAHFDEFLKVMEEYPE